MKFRLYQTVLVLLISGTTVHAQPPVSQTLPPAGGVPAVSAQGIPPGVVFPSTPVLVTGNEVVVNPGDYLEAGPNLLWVRGEYLMWWTKGNPVPPMLTTSPPGTPIATAGVLGQPTTSVLFGGSNLNDDLRSGGRFSAGVILDDEGLYAVEGIFLWLGSSAETFSQTSDAGGAPILGRPFFNTATGGQDVLFVSFPGLVAGSANVVSSNSHLFGAEANLRRNFRRDENVRIDGILGYRYFGFEDEVRLAETEINLDPNNGIPVGAQIDLVDRFSSRNRFHGGQIGVAAEVRRGRGYVELISKIAFGGNCQSVDIFGVQRQPGLPPVTGGFLALGSNVGHYEKSTFAVLPEVGLNVGFDVTDNLRAFMGYTFLYLSSVYRAGDQIDLTVNPSLIPPPAPVGTPRPVFPDRDADFWAQGLNFGMEYRY
jgi:hypothetical protein